MMLRNLALAFVLGLAACGQPQEKQEAFPVVQAPNANTRIGPDGAAGINNALPMNVAAVRAAAPEFVVAEVADQVEGQPFTAIALSAGDEEVFRIYPTADGSHVHAISTKSSQARGPTSDIVGVTLFAVAPMEEVSFCLTEFVEGQPGFACSTAADGRFWRIYRLPEGAAPAATFAEIEPDLLHESTLAEMRWIAPRVTAN
jgi:hypothetical protein